MQALVLIISRNTRACIFEIPKCEASYISRVRCITFLGLMAQREKAMGPMLLALAFVGGSTVLIIVGLMGNLYFYSRGAIRLAGSRRIRGLRAIAARSVPVRVSAGGSASGSDVDLRLSTDPSSRYARGGMMVLAIFLLLTIMAVISLLIASVH